MDRCGRLAEETTTISTLETLTTRFDALLDAEIVHSVDQLDGAAPLLGQMVRFHLGWVEPDGEPTPLELRRTVQGKRIRPYLTFLAADALGGAVEDAAPLAAAIELLHNFTLIHDDIQDRSPNRRHRATVWRIWGDAQAINAGDALFATAQRTLLHTPTTSVAPERLLAVLDAFNAMTIEIVQGQTSDLVFEHSQTVTADEYLEMIGGKTAAILRFSAWAGAMIAGADDDTARRLGTMGKSLGLGFQIRDDVLGVWGSSDVTGKDQADDIRRRKKSLPILLLMEQATTLEKERLETLYSSETIDEAGVIEVKAMLDQHAIESQATAAVTSYHADAMAALAGVVPAGSSPMLDDLLRMLDSRVS